MSDAAENDLDLDERQLCPDGGCTGVIGDDGRCKECGAVADPSVASASGNGSANGNGSGNGGEAAAAGDDDIASRRLCSDGNCLGVLGADSRCKVCGRPGE